MADLAHLIAAAHEAAPYDGTARNLAYTTEERLACALKALDYYAPVVEQAEEEAERRQSGDRHLPSPYDKMSAGDRERWLMCEAMFDASQTTHVLEANTGHAMSLWAELRPEAQQALSTVILQLVPVLHQVGLNPEATLTVYLAEQEVTDG